MVHPRPVSPTTRRPAQRGRPPRAEAEFLDAARGVFARHGFEKASMDDLAEAATTTKPTLYARFGSKEELYERVVRREADAFIATILASYEGTAQHSVDQDVGRPMAAWFAYLEGHPDVMALLFAPDRSGAAQRIAEDVEHEVVTGLAQTVELTLARSGRTAPEAARFLASMVFGATLHASREEGRRGGLGTARAVALATSFVVGGYRGLDAGLLEDPPGPRKRRTGRWA